MTRDTLQRNEVQQIIGAIVPKSASKSNAILFKDYAIQLECKVRNLLILQAVSSLWENSAWRTHECSCTTLKTKNNMFLLCYNECLTHTNGVCHICTSVQNGLGKKTVYIPFAYFALL